MTEVASRSEAKPSLWEDLIEIFYAPRRVFERRRDTPAFGLALLVFFVLIIVLTFAFKGLSQPIFDAEFKRGMAQAMAKNPQLTAEQMEAGKAIAEKFVVFVVGFYALVVPLLLGLVLWVAGKLVGSVAQVGQTMMVAVYSMFPRVLESILGAVQLLVLPESAITSRYSTSFGIGRFLDPNTTSPVVLGTLGRVDLFTLWITALMVIGLSVVGKIPIGRAAIAGVLVWLFGNLPVFWQGIAG
jgi:hypothetical protein